MQTDIAPPIRSEVVSEQSEEGRERGKNRLHVATKEPGQVLSEVATNYSRIAEEIMKDDITNNNLVANFAQTEESIKGMVGTIHDLLTSETHVHANEASLASLLRAFEDIAPDEVVAVRHELGPLRMYDDQVGRRLQTIHDRLYPHTVSKTDDVIHTSQISGPLRHNQAGRLVERLNGLAQKAIADNMPLQQLSVTLRNNVSMTLNVAVTPTLATLNQPNVVVEELSHISQSGEEALKALREGGPLEVSINELSQKVQAHIRESPKNGDMYQQHLARLHHCLSELPAVKSSLSAVNLLVDQAQAEIIKVKESDRKRLESRKLELEGLLKEIEEASQS